MATSQDQMAHDKDVMNEKHKYDIQYADSTHAASN
jgi:hypothetical protein